MAESTRPIYKCAVCGRFVEEAYHCNKPARLIVNPRERIRISKLLSGILRHFPKEYGIELDVGGWAEIEVLVKEIKRRRRGLSWITEDVVKAIALLDPKGRFEIKEDKIRARYGHTIDVKVDYQEDLTSELLYHGTVQRFLDNILREGLKPMKRRWVHLSLTKEDASLVGRRHGSDVVILIIDCDCLRKRGIKIYIASKTVRLASYVPPECIISYFSPHFF